MTAGQLRSPGAAEAVPPDRGAPSRRRPAVLAVAGLVAGCAVGLLGAVWQHRLTAWEGAARAPDLAVAMIWGGLLVGAWLGGRCPRRRAGAEDSGRLTAQAGTWWVAAALCALMADFWLVRGEPVAVGALTLGLVAPALATAAAASRLLRAWGPAGHGPWLAAGALAGLGLALLMGPPLVAVLGGLAHRAAVGCAFAAAAVIWLLPRSAPRQRGPAVATLRGSAACVATGVALAALWCWLLPRISLLWAQGALDPKPAAAALLILALGCAALAPLVRALVGAAALPAAASLLVAVWAVGLHEHLAPADAAVRGGLGLAVALAVPAALTGALVGLVVDRHGLAGAPIGRALALLLVGWALGAWGIERVLAPALGADPRWAPLIWGGAAVLALLPATAWAIPAGLVAVAIPALAWSGLPAPWSEGRPGPVRVGGRPLLVQSGTGAVSWDRGSQELVFSADGFVLDRWGPDRGAAVAGHLAVLIGSSPVAVLGLGNGHSLAAAGRASTGAVTAVCHREVDLELWPARRGEGPLPSPVVAPLPAVERIGLCRYLARQPRGAAGALVLGTPVTAAEPWLCGREFHDAARRALGDGVLVQRLPLDRLTPGLLEAAVVTAAACHPHVEVWLVGDCAMLLAAGALLPRGAAAWDRRLAEAPADSRWELHAAGLATGVDLEMARVFRSAGALAGGGNRRPLVVPAREPVPGPARLRANLQRLRSLQARAAAGRGAGALRLLIRVADGSLLDDAVARLTRLRGRYPESVLLYRDEQRARLRLEVDTLTALLAAESPDVARARQRVRAWEYLDAPAAMLQAVQGLADGRGRRALPAAEAGRRAVALDPEFFESAPAVLAELAPARPQRGPLEDLARLPGGAALAQQAAADDARGLALRCRYPVLCARALLSVLADRSLTPAEARALRRVVDPVSLARAAEVAREAGRAPEALAFWRRDLPMPQPLTTLLTDGDAERRALAEALAERRDGRALAALAALLVDADAGVRTAAGVALVHTVGDRIEYDPQWPETRLREAANRVRAMHNRWP